MILLDIGAYDPSGPLTVGQIIGGLLIMGIMALLGAAGRNHE